MFKKNISEDVTNVLNGYDVSLLRVFDESERYTLVKYGDVVTNNIGDVRGWIFDKKEKKIVCKSFPHTPIKVFSGNPDMLDQDEYQISLEGTIIRVWSGYDDDTSEKKLFFSTHSRISCANSRWNSKKTFFQMFDEAIAVLKFDKNKFMDGNIHILMLVHQENQLTNLYNLTYPTIYYLETLKCDTFESIKCDIDLPRVDTLTRDQAFHFMISGGHGIVSTGINNKVKIVSPQYNSALDIVGGKNLFHRYVELMRSSEEGLLRCVVPYSRLEEVDGFRKRYEDMVYDAIPHLTKLFIHWKKTGEKIDVRYHKFFITIRNNKNPSVMSIIKSAIYKYDPVEVKKICKRILREVQNE